MAKSSAHTDNSTGFGGRSKPTYQQIKHFEVQLNRRMHITECDDDKQGDNKREDTFVFSGMVRYTLLDVLTTVFGYFGNPIFDPRYQDEIDAELEMFRRFEEDGLDEETDSDDPNAG